MAKKSLVTGAVNKFEGQLTVVIPGKGACYRCLFEKPPPQDVPPQDIGLLGVIPGVIGTLQVAEVLKLIAGFGEALIGQLLMYDALKPSFRKIKIPKNSECPVCSDNPTITEITDHR
jgi:adenylyltransferase/sulfurtransferase